MSRVYDPDNLCTEPLPTLAARRRDLRERLAKAEAGYEEFSQVLRVPLSPRAVTAVLFMQGNYALQIALLHRAIAYLGEPDPRLDLYRIFQMVLPPE